MLLSDKKADFIYDIHKKMEDNNVILAFTGEFDVKVVNALVYSARKKMRQMELDMQVQKKIHNIMVECMENIFRHSRKIDHTTIRINDFSMFTLNKMDNEYYMTTGNYIHNEDIALLQKKIEGINSLTTPEKKALYRDVISNHEFTEHDTAGLGIIDMAIKSGSKLTYEFKQVDENISFYIFQVKIIN